MRESAVENYLKLRAKQEDDETRKCSWIGRNGAPDRFLMSHRKGIWLIEMKRPGECPEPHQFREIARINAFAGLEFGGAMWMNCKEDVDEFYR